MQNIINSAVTVADIKKASAEGWTPSNVLGAIRLVTEREAQKLQGVVDALEARVHLIFGDRANTLMNAMPYGIDNEDVTEDEWQLLGDWYNAAMDRCTIYVSDRKIAEVLHIEVSNTLTKVADVIRSEWEVFGLDKI